MPDEPYNLIHQRWIPVRDEEGNVWDIAPWEVTKPGGPDDQLPIALAAPRPDFDGALIQFLIGLVQTAFAPETEREWRLKFKEPPKAEELKTAFERYEHAFNLDGDGPRFMQDHASLDDVSEKHLQLLLLDGPSENALNNNTDHFVKRDQTMRFSPAVAAMALYTFQTNVHYTAAGAGHSHQSTLRGPGPVTTIVLGETLWQTVWLNTILQGEFDALGASAERHSDHDIFCWLAPIRGSEAKQEITREDVHPAHMYWPTPRRIRLIRDSDKGECSVSAKSQPAVFSKYKTDSDGIDYHPPWNYPLCPNTGLNAVKTSSSQLGYQQWTEFVFSKSDYRPALSVQKCWQRSTSLLQNERLRLWVFGFRIRGDRATVRAYRERKMPLFTVTPEVRVEFENFAHQLVNAADHLAGELKTALKRGLYGKKKNGGWDFAAHIKSSAEQKSVLDDTATRFWRDTEPLFFDYLSEAQSVLERNKDHDPDDDLTLDLRRKWLEGLREDHLLLLYDEVTASSTFHGADPKSVALARNELFWAAHESNDDIREKLNLPKE